MFERAFIQGDRQTLSCVFATHANSDVRQSNPVRNYHADLGDPSTYDDKAGQGQGQISCSVGLITISFTSMCEGADKHHRTASATSEG